MQSVPAGIFDHTWKVTRPAPRLAMIFVWRVSGEQLAAFGAEEVTDVRELKDVLRSRYGFPPFIQQLLHKGKSLEDSAKLESPSDIQLLLAVSTPAQQTQAVRALSTACILEDFEMVKVLLAAGADKDSFGDYGCTPLMNAALRNHVEIARLLLEAGASKDLHARQVYMMQDLTPR